MGSYAPDGHQLEKKSKSRSNRPLWQLDPVESFSDWMLVVKVKGKEQERQYHVHKAQLASGRRSSEYFKKLFNYKMAEHESLSTSLQLEETAALAVPIMLDYLYQEHAGLKANTYNSAALRHLANYFGIEEMFDEANRFIRDDLSASTASTYLVESALYHDDKLLEAVKKVFIVDFDGINHEDRAMLPAHLFRDVFNEAQKSWTLDDGFASLVVTSYCNSRNGEMDREIFMDITEESIVRSIHDTTVIPLLFYSLKHRNKSLLRRCAQAAVENWDAVIVDAIASKNSLYARIPQSLKVMLLERSLCGASYKRSAESFLHETEGILDEFNDTYEARTGPGDATMLLPVEGGIFLNERFDAGKGLQGGIADEENSVTDEESEF